MRELVNTLQALKPWLLEEVRPAVIETCYDGNPLRFRQWQGNCCLQTSIAVNYLLTERLRLMGYKEIQSWEGQFTDVIFGKHVQYNHAWVYCEHESEPGLNLLIDISRNHKECLVVFAEKNEYPSHPDYDDMVTLSRERLNVTRLMQKPEYYTGLRGKEFISLVKLKLNENRENQPEDPRVASAAENS